MPSRKSPLECKDHVEIDPASGTTIHRTTYERGLLHSEDIKYEDFSAGLLAIENRDPRKKFNELRSRARAVLREAHLPTDEDGGESRIAEGLMQPGPITPEKFAAGFTFKDWSKLVEERTERLSPERSAMLLIKAVNAILQKNLDNDALRHVLFLVHATHYFEMLVLGINEAAVAGRRAENGRVKGPQARVVSSNRKKEITWEIANAHWKSMPLDRTKLDQTARAISDEVKRRLEAEDLKPVKTRRIIDYLRELRDSAG
jgi:hypothetical protein